MYPLAKGTILHTYIYLLSLPYVQCMYVTRIIIINFIRNFNKRVKKNNKCLIGIYMNNAFLMCTEIYTLQSSIYILVIIKVQNKQL